ncbi:hypothetical protein A0G_1218, partial [Streptococcus iniae 9117]
NAGPSHSEAIAPFNLSTCVL